MGKSSIQYTGTVSSGKRYKPIDIITKKDFDTQPIIYTNCGNKKKIDDKIIIEMIKEGKNKSEIARFFNIDRKNIQTKIKKLIRDGVIIEIF
jgi:hypothetical protein